MNRIFPILTDKQPSASVSRYLVDIGAKRPSKNPTDKYFLQNSKLTKLVEGRAAVSHAPDHLIANRMHQSDAHDVATTLQVPKDLQRHVGQHKPDLVNTAPRSTPAYGSSLSERLLHKAEYPTSSTNYDDPDSIDDP